MQSFRKHGRKLVQFDLTFKHRLFGDVRAEARDISETGMFILCKDATPCFSVGEEIQVNLDHNKEGFIPRVLKVVRITDDGIGLAY